MLQKWIAAFRREERGQDLIEYSLLIGFVAIAAVGMFVSSGDSLKGIWTSANTTIATAANPNPATGGGHDHDHDH